ncbi:gamma-glutamylcyclotransferase family protein [Ferrovibrio sp.]|uniref:gamma-glutamylcyclotransferase family protein n=1 Tax=Ferrovibrio sp. TaxID=1917215 RepID=UPI00311DB070
MYPAVWYFAYGSNMNPARLADDRLLPRGVRVEQRLPASLPGWALAFNKPWAKFNGAGAANIVPREGGLVWGTINLMAPAGLDVLDEYEGVATGQYRRQPMTVFGADGRPVETITYIAENVAAQDLLPHREYLAHLLAGRDLLPAGYVAMLERQPCHG